jgi:SAM-dependent methyltransferase
MQPEAVLEEILRILKPHGLLFITVPNRFYLFETHGFQIRGRQIGNLLGIGIPLFSMAPHFLRRRFERARIYSEAEALSMLRKCCFEPLVMKYLMPSLDMFRKTALTKAISRVFHSLEKMPIFEKLGSSIMIVSEKPEQHRRDLICGLRR